MPPHTLALFLPFVLKFTLIAKEVGESGCSVCVFLSAYIHHKPKLIWTLPVLASVKCWFILQSLLHRLYLPGLLNVFPPTILPLSPLLLLLASACVFQSVLLLYVPFIILRVFTNKIYSSLIWDWLISVSFSKEKIPVKFDVDL